MAEPDTGYATVADWLQHYDARTIADLASDEGTPADGLATHPVLVVLLQRASGAVEAACRCGKMYTPDQLAALTGYTQALLTGLVCDLAMGYLIARRPEKFDDQALRNHLEAAENYLDQLRRGERVFGGDEQIEAGLPTVDGPSTVEYAGLNLLPDRTRHFYPARSTRLPVGR